MSSRKRNVLAAVERIGYFGEANPVLAVELPATVELFAANQINIDRLHQAGIASTSASGAGLSETRSKVARAREIIADLRLIVKTAKIIEKKNNDFKNSFTMPRGGLTYQQIVERANSFIADAPANQAGFDKYALTAQFFNELKINVDGLRETSQEQADAKRTSVGATADIEAILEDTLDTREELDRALKNHYRDNPQKLAEWLTASHIERKRKTNEQPPPDENPTTP